MIGSVSTAVCVLILLWFSYEWEGRCEGRVVRLKVPDPRLPDDGKRFVSGGRYGSVFL